MRRTNSLLSLAGILLVVLIFTALPRTAGALLATQTPQAYLPFIRIDPSPTPTATPVAPPPWTPPRYSTSVYMDWIKIANTLDEIKKTNEYIMGCALGTLDLRTPGKQESLVVLDYGAPKYQNGFYGASALWRSGFVSTNAVKNSVIYFGYGYWDCVETDFDSHLTIAIGTTNYFLNVTNASVNAAHGKAWAQMVNEAEAWFRNTCARGCDGQVDAIGAVDIELAWNRSPDGNYNNATAKTLDWVNGYLANTPRRLVNFGALEGCPYFAAPGATCAGGWTKDAILNVTTGRIQPLPEVYAYSGVNAQQWYLMSVYSISKGKGKFDFTGTMTTMQACAGSDEFICNPPNPPERGWQQLYDLVNTNMATYDSIQFSTDIKWLNGSSVPPVIYALPGQEVKQAEPLALESAAPLEIVEGVYEGSGGILSPRQADIRNTWEGYYNGAPLRVLAGAPPALDGEPAPDPSAGLLVVLAPEKDGPQFYAAPGSPGPLRILAVNDGQVLLEGQMGMKLTFRLDTRVFDHEGQ